MDIIILTSIIATLFIVFLIATFREFTKMGEKPFVYTKERGPRADLLNFVGRIFDNEHTSLKMTQVQKEIVYKAMHRTVADMESDGVYFAKEVKEELQKQRDDLYCEYSGLPSIAAYDDNDHLIGHS